MRYYISSCRAGRLSLSLSSTRKGCNNPIKYQYSLRIKSKMSASSEVSISYIFHFIYRREWAHSPFYTSEWTKKWICTKLTHNKYVAKLWKPTGKDRVNSTCTHQFTRSWKLERERESPLIILIKVAHSDAFHRFVLLKCTAVNWCPEKNWYNKTNKKTIGHFILPSLSRLLLILHISWNFCDISLTARGGQRWSFVALNTVLSFYKIRSALNASR